MSEEKKVASRTLSYILKNIQAMGNKSIGLIPKTKKKLSSFFTDESGKISKENILGMSVGGMILTGLLVEGISAGTHGDSIGHTSTVPHSSSPGGHVSVGHVNSDLAGHANSSRNGIVNYQPSGGHLSQGHVSGNTHNNHANHASGPAHTSGPTGDDG